MGHAKAPLPVGTGAGKRASTMAEKFALEELQGNGGAVHPNKGSAGPRTPAVEQLRRLFFSRAAFTQQKNRSIRGRGELDHLHNLAPTAAHAYRPACFRPTPAA